MATTSRIIGTATPTARSTGHGMPLTFAAGAPIAAARSVSASRWVRGAVVGTCQARPSARSSVPRVASVAATSGR